MQERSTTAELAGALGAGEDGLAQLRLLEEAWDMASFAVLGNQRAAGE
jgi:hypothetical protein